MLILKGLPRLVFILMQTSCLIFGFSNEFLCPEVVFQAIPTEGSVQFVNIAVAFL